MRKDLDGIDNTKKWLISKDRNPLEDQHLDRLRMLREEQKIVSGEPIIEMCYFPFLHTPTLLPPPSAPLPPSPHTFYIRIQ